MSRDTCFASALAALCMFLTSKQVCTRGGARATGSMSRDTCDASALCACQHVPDKRPKLNNGRCHRFSVAELEAFDAEGRAVVTDHGEFVLFNVYGPAITNAETADERFAFKLRFFEVHRAAHMHA